MPDAAVAVNTLEEAFNEGNGSLRAQLLEKCCSPGVRVTVDGELIARSRSELDAVIAHSREDPRFFVRVRQHGCGPNDVAWTRWRIQRLHRAPELQDIRIRRSPDGLITELDARTASDAEEHRNVMKRLQQAAIANPIPAIGALGGTLYLALRIPVGLFYGDLGVTPDEVGFGPQVLVPQSLGLLASFLLFMLLLLLMSLSALPLTRAVLSSGRLWRKRQKWRAAVTASLLTVCGGVVSVAYSAFSSLVSLPWWSSYGVFLAILVLVGGIAQAMPWLKHDLREEKDKQQRAGLSNVMQGWTVQAAFYGAVLLLIGLPIWSLMDANTVREGGTAGGRITPWRALPVQLHWSKAAHPRVHNTCRRLRLLGVGNGQVVVFDSVTDRVARVPVGDATASVKRDCPRAGTGIERGWPVFDGKQEFHANDEETVMRGLLRKHNKLLGGHGDDRIIAGDAGDVLFGDYKYGVRTAQRDVLIGGRGMDRIYTSDGRNVVVTNGAADRVFARWGRGRITCTTKQPLIFLSAASKPRYKLVGCTRITMRGGY